MTRSIMEGMAHRTGGVAGIQQEDMAHSKRTWRTADGRVSVKFKLKLRAR